MGATSPNARYELAAAGGTVFRPATLKRVRDMIGALAPMSQVELRKVCGPAHKRNPNQTLVQKIRVTPRGPRHEGGTEILAIRGWPTI